MRLISASASASVSTSVSASSTTLAALEERACEAERLRCERSQGRVCVGCGQGWERAVAGEAQSVARQMGSCTLSHPVLLCRQAKARAAASECECECERECKREAVRLSFASALILLLSLQASSGTLSAFFDSTRHARAQPIHSRPYTQSGPPLIAPSLIGPRPRTRSRASSTFCFSRTFPLHPSPASYISPPSHTTPISPALPLPPPSPRPFSSTSLRRLRRYPSNRLPTSAAVAPDTRPLPSPIPMLASTDPMDQHPLSLLLPLVKIATLLATGYAVDCALSPPNPPPAPKACIDNRTLFERAIRYVTLCSKVLTWLIVLCDALATLHLAAPSPLTRPLASILLPCPLLSDPPAPSLTAPSQRSAPAAFARALTVPHPLLLAGATAAAGGAVLRLACFRALGALFTFELTISPTHTLVTDGPYAHVRHPSYAGVYAVLLGASGVMLAPGAWLREAWLGPSVCALARGAGLGAGWGECTAWDGVGAGTVLAWAFAVFWTTKVVYALRSTNKRVGTEDAELHRVFGGQWEEWAGRVPWRLVPGLF
ncbi:hypothetical protein BC628DRAFT_1363242 [Trametes gibbosa]|nr:hypothetical protein BC628DRAFT_1363242 [Trametes gibbosa]